MEINFNLGSLQIVHPTLMEYLKEIQANVESNLVLIRDEKKVATNYDGIKLLNKVQGSLKMIGLSGLVKVLQLCQESLNNVKEVKFDTAKNVQILEACGSTLKNVALYLETLLLGELNQPTKFFNEYSYLASLIGKNVSIKELFSPKLEMKEDSDSVLQEQLQTGIVMDNANKQNVLKVLNESYATVKAQNEQILNILNNNGNFKSTEEKAAYHEACKALYQALNNVQNLKLGKHVYVLTGLQKLFACTTSPTFNDEIAKVFALGTDTLKNTFTLMETSIAQWIEEVNSMTAHDRTGTIRVDEETSKDVLFSLIQILKENKKLQEMPAYKDVTSYFDFNFYNNQLKNTVMVSTVMQKNPEVAQQIDKILIDIKEELTLMTSKQATSEEFLILHSGKFINANQKLNDVLVQVEVKDLAGILNALNAIFTKVKNKEFAFTESLQKEISLAVVVVEYGVNTFVKSMVKEEDRSNFASQVSLQQKRLLFAATNKEEDLANLPLPELDEKSKKHDERKAFVKMFQELNKDFNKAEAILDQFLKNQEDGIDEIKDVFQALKSARGIFSIIGKPELGAVVAEIIKVWESIVKSGIDSVSPDLLQNSITWVSGVSLIIAASKDDNEIEANEIAGNLLKKFNTYNNKNTVAPVETPVAVVEETPVAVAPAVTKVTKEIKPVAANANLYQDETNDPDLLEVYLMEAEEVLENMQTSLKTLDKNPNDTEEVTNIRRYFHTLKGSGKMVGLKYLGEAGWIAEQTLNKVLADELKLSVELISTIRFAETQFHNWVEELKATNKVGVDLFGFKEEFAKLNNSLTTTFEIVNLGGNTVEEVTVEDSAPVENNVVVVGDKEISSMLYNLFVEESANHVKSMKQFVGHKDNKNGAVISSDFMLHAHTLASIARTVNLLDCAKLASKLEMISNLSIEKSISLNADEMKVLTNAVEHVEKFRSIATGVEINPEYMEKLLNNLNDLHNSIDSRNIPVAMPEVKTPAPVANFDMDLLVQKLAAVMPEPKEVVAQPAFDMDSLLDALVARLKPAMTSNAAPSNINMEDLTKNVVDSLQKTITENVAQMNASLKQSMQESVAKMNSDFAQSLKENSDKVEKLQNDFKLVLENNTGSFTKANEAMMKNFEANVEKVEAASKNLQSALEVNVENVNTTLNNLLAEKVELINSNVGTALQNSLTEINTTVKSALDESLSKVASEVNESINNSVTSSIEEIKDMVESVENELAQIKEIKLQTIDAASVTNDIKSSLASLVEAQYKELNKVLNENKYNTKEIVNELFNKIEASESNINKLVEEQRGNDKATQESLNELTTQFKEAVKNSGGKKGFLGGLFGK